MPEQGRTVLVTGLPTKVPGETLQDKLCIHFQRGSNGGGEVLSVSAVRTSADFALITFEDSGVAQRVIQQHQILELDGERFNLTVKEHPAGTEPDKIVLNLSATVDCSQLSAPKRTLKALNKNYPDVHVDHSLPRGLWNLSGSYSAVQAALAQLLGPNRHETLKTGVDNKPSHPPPTPFAQASHEQSAGLGAKEERPLVKKHTSSLQRDVTPGGYEEVRGAAAMPPGSEEDFSLMVDEDLFRYLQKYCGEEYHQILRRNGVAVVDYTHQGLTTLLLQASSADGERELECLRTAREEISRLYEANQANVCRDKIAKALLPREEVLKRGTARLRSNFTKLLLSEDEQSIYLTGSRDDVYKARKFLLLHDHNGEDGAEVTSPRRFQDSWPAANEDKASAVSPGASQSPGSDQAVEEHRSDGPSKVRLAAQFNKDSRLAPIGSKASDLTVRGHPPSKTKPRQGPMLGYNVLSDTKAPAFTSLTGGDSWMRNGNASADTGPKAPVSSIQPEIIPTPSAPKTSGSGLRRASSFSGAVQTQEQENSPKRDSETGKGRERSSSFSGGSTKELSAQIVLGSLTWLHVKKAYKPRIEELTSEIQMTENNSERSDNIRLLLTGTNASKVAACKEALQKLFDSVNVDFNVHQIPLSDLGGTEPTNEALLACCAEIQSLYKKISIELVDKTLYLLGPKQMCSQVGKLLREVFSGAQLSARHQNYSQPSASGGDSSPTSAINGANGRVSQRGNAVTREKVRLPFSGGRDGRDTEDSTQASRTNGPLTSPADESATRRQRSPEAAGGTFCNFCSRLAAKAMTPCGLRLCPDCLGTFHNRCSVCGSRAGAKTWGIQGKMTYANLPMSIPGYVKDPVIKITYTIPDGIQGEEHESPGSPFKGGVFEAYLPDCEQTRSLLPRLDKAFKAGCTFTVTKGSVVWHMIPHKTSLQGGKSAKGYPDSSYLSRLSNILTSEGL